MKQATRLVLLLGAVGIGLFLLRSAPRDVTLVYGLAAGRAVTALDVDIRRGGQEIRRAEFRFTEGAPAQVRHEVRLPEGSYQLLLHLVEPGRSRTVERSLTVTESGTVVLPLE
jgi:hypothetical protein